MVGNQTEAAVARNWRVYGKLRNGAAEVGVVGGSNQQPASADSRVKPSQVGKKGSRGARASG